MKRYKGVLYLAGILLVASTLAIAANNASESAPQPAFISQAQTPTAAATSAVQAPPQTQTSPQPSGLSNDNHYLNSEGESVHSPAYSNSVPAGATAQCSDGTYSFSEHARGTCSHHGGVAQWLY
jgi:hypothetical protein